MMKIQIQEGPSNVVFEDRVNYIIQMVDTILPSGLSLSIIEAAGDLIVGTGSESAARLPIGLNNESLIVNAGLPAWQAADHGALIGLADDDHTQYVKHSLATAVSDFLVASGAGAFVKKTLTETLTILGKAAASGLASLDALSLVVQNPANATATPTASTIPIADPYGTLDGWVGRSASIEVFAAATALAIGDGKRYFGPAPAFLAGFDLKKVTITVFAKSTAGLPTVQLARGRQADAITAHAWVDMLLTAVTIDINEFSSLYATTAAVINTANDDVLEGDLFRVDVDAAGTGATGLWLTAEFAKA